MHFICLDVETANADLASICQIGIVHFVDGQITKKWDSLVDPEDYFDAMNVSVHGIDESCISDAPKFPEICSLFIECLTEAVVVSHTAFDQAAVRSLFEKYSIKTPEIRWLDSARVVRRTWPDLAQRGYGLAPVAKRLGIEFRHHHAVEDARAAGEILLHAIRESGMSVDEWVVRARKPINGASGSSSGVPVKREGNPEGPLYGEVVVFTGALSIPRREAADIAALAGCNVEENVTKNTTLLVVGDQDVQRLVGHEKSSKHRKAEKLIGDGQAIRVLRETDFRRITSDCQFATS